jgi:hypothetical protein
MSRTILPLPQYIFTLWCLAKKRYVLWDGALLRTEATLPLKCTHMHEKRLQPTFIWPSYCTEYLEIYKLFNKKYLFNTAEEE